MTSRETYGHCPPWCIDREYQGTPDHPTTHSGPLFGGPAQRGNGSLATLFVQPVADYVHGVPADAGRVNFGNPRIIFALDDEPPVFAVTSSTARSVAAGLIRMADQLETGPAAPSDQAQP